MRLGLFGGTFDPPHVGHITVANAALVRLGLERVIFMPAGNPWLKTGTPVTEACHRVQMTRMATEHNPKFEVSEMETNRLGPSYTVETLRELNSMERGTRDLYLIVGLDALVEFDLWHNPSEILDLATLAGYRRLGFEDVPRRSLEVVRRGSSSDVSLIEGPLANISSTVVRERVSLGRSIARMVPCRVEEYILTTEL